MMDEQILVVDDEVHVLEACSRILENSGFNVTAISSGIDAIEILDHTSFDLLLTDVRMPNISGLDILKKFKKKEPNSAAVVITAEGTMGTAVEAIGIGADGFVVKPFSKNGLINTIKASMDKMKVARENAKLKSLLPIFEITRKLMQKVDVNELLDVFVDMAHKEVRANSVSVMLGEAEGILTVGASKGLDSDYSRGLKVRKGTGVAWKVMEGGYPLLLSDEDTSIPFRDLLKRETISSSLIIPLKVEAETMGVMNLTKLKSSKYPHFSYGDLDFMTILSAQAATALKNARLVEDQRRLFLSTVKSLSAAIDTKSAWTAGHSERVTSYALLLGKKMGFSDYEMKHLELAGLLHDIGKIGIHEEILDKSSGLTDKEYEAIKHHPVAGATILLHLEELRDVIPAIRHHHERFDGNGYPDGIRGEDIPIMARVLAVADSFDAMKADRPYREGMSMNAIINEFDRCSGSQFDPYIVDALKNLCESKKLQLYQ